MKTGLQDYLQAVSEKAAQRAVSDVDSVDDLLEGLLEVLVDWVYIKRPTDKWSTIEKSAQFIKTRAYPLSSPAADAALKKPYGNFVIDRVAGFLIIDASFGGHTLTLQQLYALYSGNENAPRQIKKYYKGGTFTDDFSAKAVEEGMVMYLPSDFDAVIKGKDVQLTEREFQLLDGRRVIDIS